MFSNRRVHWWYQRTICAWYCARNIEAKAEWNLNGKRADVGVRKNGKLWAVEVAMSPKNEAVNVQEDLKAGFDAVVVACANAKVRAAVQEKLSPVLTEEQWKKVRLLPLSELESIKAALS